MNNKKRVSVIIPAYNEEKTLPVLLTKLLDDNIRPHIEKIIIANDGSTDGTLNVSLDFESRFPEIKTISLEKNSGKAAAVRKGIEHAGEIIVIQDADLEYDPENIPALLSPIVNNQADVVIGSRFLPRNKKTYPFNKYVIANKIMTGFVNLLGRQKTSDAMSGYKVITKDAFENLACVEGKFDQCAEITIKSLNSKYRLIDVPITYNPRTKQEGKKIGFKDFLTVMKTIWKHRSYRA